MWIGCAEMRGKLVWVEIVSLRSSLLGFHLRESNFDFVFAGTVSTVPYFFARKFGGECLCFCPRIAFGHFKAI